MARLKARTSLGSTHRCCRSRGHCCVAPDHAATRDTGVVPRRRRSPVPVPTSAFAGFRFPAEVITLAVRWYLRFGLSYRDVEELLAERGIEVDHVSVYRWVQRFTPLLAEAARPVRHAVGDRWQVDETYVKVSGSWQNLYRAVDQFGHVDDVLLSSKRDGRAARQFFVKAIAGTQTEPAEVVTDRAAAYPGVLDERPAAPPPAPPSRAGSGPDARSARRRGRARSAACRPRSSVLAWVATGPSAGRGRIRSCCWRTARRLGGRPGRASLWRPDRPGEQRLHDVSVWNNATEPARLNNADATWGALVAGTARQSEHPVVIAIGTPKKRPLSNVLSTRAMLHLHRAIHAVESRGFPVRYDLIPES
jgi:transposase, IS6 family